MARKPKTTLARNLTVPPADPGMIPGARWQGERCKARRVLVIVGVPARPTWWSAHLVGEVFPAVEVTVPGTKPFYISNEHGEGEGKVRFGMGSPLLTHRNVPVARVLTAEEVAALAQESPSHE